MHDDDSIVILLFGLVSFVSSWIDNEHRIIRSGVDTSIRQVVLGINVSFGSRIDP
jgi:hypothetical protein